MTKTKMYFLFIIALSIIFMVGCESQREPKGDPKDVVIDYYHSVRDGNLEAAYEKLAEVNKKAISKEDYILYQNIMKVCRDIRGFEVTKVKEQKNIVLDGNKYENVIVFDVAHTLKNYSGEMEVNGCDRRVVNDNGTWKIYWNVDVKSQLKRARENMYQMYFLAKTEEKI